MKRLCLAVILTAFPAGVAFATPPEIKTSFDLRLRWEGVETPSRSAAADRSYNLGLGRARLGLDVGWTKWKLHGMVQAAGLTGLPENPAFAAGVNYLSANGGDTSPAQIGLAELSATYTDEGLKLILGRQPYVDGNETATGVAHLDNIKRRLLSDRLVGVSEWPNVGRRFDGASVGYGQGSTHLAGFALRPLHGTFDHEEAFKEIDDVTVFGTTLTGKHGAWIPATEVRVFAIQYEDNRRITQSQTGGDLSLTTAGASILTGNATGHVLLWGVLQAGDWGAVDQKAWAFIANAGHNFAGIPGKPMIHIGWEQSSGDSSPGGDHETFFNILPTNHKYYGIMDYVDFPNLRDVYIESFWSLGEKVKARFAFHDFALTRRTDAWYGGSGAFEKTSFGYTPRLPASGQFPSNELAREADLEVTWTLPRGLQLGTGGGLFWGGRAAEAFVPVESNGSWIYVELNWKR